MKTFFLTLLTVAIVGSSAASILPGGRIINGWEAEHGEAPYIVSLQLYQQHFCGGSLINERTILTAAHCLFVQEFEVVAGAHNYRQLTNAQRRTVKGTHVRHEDYPGGVAPNDIGLIFVHEPFNFVRGGIAPVSAISLTADGFKGSQQGVLYGWGRNSSNVLSNVLQKLDVEILGYEACRKYLPRVNNMTSSNVCTFKVGTTDGACNGDSGGPLVARQADGSPQLVGIVSWGYTPCVELKYPSIYTAVSAHAAWIAKHQHDY